MITVTKELAEPDTFDTAITNLLLLISFLLEKICLCESPLMFRFTK